MRLPNIEPPPVASFFERDQNARLRTKKWSAWAWGTVTAALLVGGAVASYFQWDDVQAMKSWVSEWVNRRSHNEQILDTKGLPVGGTPLLPTEAGP